ncbi:site-specific integrase [Rhizobium giardinii]|uniref:site-specific integrase n=1 Tax=Rhizobium giardinii TaxID=56731 RepID=UPI0039DF50C3
MRNKKNASTEGRGLPELPELVVTKDGAAFDPRPSDWYVENLIRNQFIRFSVLKNLSNRMIHCLKLAIIWHLQNNSFSHARNLHYSFTVFYRHAFEQANDVYEEVELRHILSFRASVDTSSEWKLGILRVLLEDMERLGLNVCSREACEYLAEATIRGNVKGTSIRTRDPRTGAFNDNELLAVQSALNDAYAVGKISLYEFAIAWLFLGYGPRPVQVAALKEKDLIVSDGTEGRFYALRIPRAKQAGQAIRESLKTRYCSKQIGQLLEAVICMNRRRRAEINLQGEDWPMFMSNRRGDLSNLLHHMTSGQIGRILAEIESHVPGVKTNARRFRITLAQRAVDDGKDKHTVAELLDHSDTQNIGVYYEASPAMVLRLDRHLAMEMAPIAQAFAGVVVNTEDEARRRGDQSSRIFDRSLNNGSDEALGSCGQMSFCGLAIPFACYTCRHFKPWRDGPHEEFMAALIADRNRMVAEDMSPKLYTIRDRTILAVAEVIQLCAGELEEEVAA